jgi:hypothetical protein
MGTSQTMQVGPVMTGEGLAAVSGIHVIVLSQSLTNCKRATGEWTAACAPIRKRAGILQAEFAGGVTPIVAGFFHVP